MTLNLYFFELESEHRNHYYIPMIDKNIYPVAFNPLDRINRSYQEENLMRSQKITLHGKYEMIR